MFSQKQNNYRWYAESLQKCKKVLSDSYYLLHKEKINAYSSAWGKANPEKKNQSRSRAYHKDPKKYCERQRVYVKNNYDAVHARRRAYRNANAHQLYEKYKLWVANNRDKVRQYSQIRSKELHNCYVALIMVNKTGLSARGIPSELIEVTRARLQMVRTMKELKGAINEKRK